MISLSGSSKSQPTPIERLRSLPNEEDKNWMVRMLWCKFNSQEKKQAWGAMQPLEREKVYSLIHNSMKMAFLVNLFPESRIKILEYFDYKTSSKLSILHTTWEKVENILNSVLNK